MKLKKVVISALGIMMLTSAMTFGGISGDNFAASSEKTVYAAETTYESGSSTKGYTIPNAKKYKMGKVVNVDLDGDGTKERVKVRIISRAEYGDVKVGIYINKKRVKTVSIIDDGAEYFNHYYYITDINKKDKKKEIALTDFGPSNDYATTFYGWVNGKIKTRGCIDGLIFSERSDGTFAYSPDSFVSVNGNGTVTTNVRMDNGLSCTLFVKADYKLTKGILKLKAADPIYDMTDTAKEQLESAKEDGYLNYLMHINKDLKIYSKMSRDSSTVLLKKDDNKVLLFTGIDGGNWMRVMYTSGTDDKGAVTGYLYTDKSMIYNPSTNEFEMGYEVINNLPYAD